jgi:hypothetical protein
VGDSLFEEMFVGDSIAVLAVDLFGRFLEEIVEAVACSLEGLVGTGSQFGSKSSLLRKVIEGIHHY